MTVLTIQIGQCGNQLGFEFYDTIYRHINLSRHGNFRNKLIEMYFDEEYKYENNIFPIIEYEERKTLKTGIVDHVASLNNFVARCILIDMEPKVIERCLNFNSSENVVMPRKRGTYGQYNNRFRDEEDGYHFGSRYDKEERRKEIEEEEKKKNIRSYSCGYKEHYDPPNKLIKIFDKNKEIGMSIDTSGIVNNDKSSFHTHDKDNLYASEEREASYYHDNSEHNNNTDAYGESYNRDVSKESQLKKLKRNDYSTNIWKYNNCNFIYGQSGSGNNWSYGFNIHANNICEHFLNIINRELEKNETKESIDNILLFHSLAGGSGSGISSYLSYILKDEYPKINLFNICVLPYMFGEISVQSLNSVLCLSSLYDVSDCVILFENDKFELMCKKINNANINTEEINKYISLFLTYSIGLPVDTTMNITGSCYNYTNMMNSVLSDLCTHPNYKLLATRYLPQVFKETMKFEQNSFNMLLKRMHKMLIKGCIVDSELVNKNCTMSEQYNLDNVFGSLSSRHLRKRNIFKKDIKIPIYFNETNSNSYFHQKYNSILLKKNQKSYAKNFSSANVNPHVGSFATTKKQIAAKIVNDSVASTNFIHNNVIFNSKMILRGAINENINFDVFKDHVLYNNKSVNPIDIYVDENKIFDFNNVSMISNCLTHIPTLKKILQNAKMLYSTNAYMYQYNTYGVSHDQIHNALMCVEQIINSYEQLSCE